MKVASFNGKPVYIRETLEERALRLCEQHLPKGSKEAAYVLRIIGTKARNAAKREPARQARLAVKQKRNALLKAAGEEPTAKTKKSLLHEADKWFSRFIRLRDANGAEFVRCFTCRNIVHIKEIQNGHWIRRENWGTRFNEINCHSQGVCCNFYKGGAEDMYEKRIEQRYGPSMPDKLRELAEKNKRRPTDAQLVEIAERYKAKVQELGGWPE